MLWTVLVVEDLFFVRFWRYFCDLFMSGRVFRLLLLRGQFDALLYLVLDFTALLPMQLILFVLFRRSTVLIQLLVVFVPLCVTVDIIFTCFAMLLFPMLIKSFCFCFI